MTIQYLYTGAIILKLHTGSMTRDLTVEQSNILTGKQIKCSLSTDWIPPTSLPQNPLPAQKMTNPTCPLQPSTW